jgi:hypothetical protein
LAALPHDSGSSYYFGTPTNKSTPTTSSISFASTSYLPPLDQNLLLSRDAIVNLPVVGVERTRDEGGWGLAADELKYK